MRRLAGLPDDGSRDADLPDLAHDLANAKTSEKRNCMQDRFVVRCGENGAATTVPPIATKEILAMYETGISVAPTLFQLDDLLAGISAFSCGWRSGSEQGEIVQQRQIDYDNQQRGGTQVTLAEQRQLSTKEVHMPSSSWEATQMLNGLSIVLDEIQGAAHDHARLFRIFLNGPFTEIVHAIESMTPAERGRVPHLWPRLLREVQLIMGNYLRGVLQATPAAMVPTYETIRDLVLRRQWNLLATIPDRYLMNQGPRRPSPEAPPADVSARPVANPTPNNGWQRLYQNSGRTLSQLRANAPQDADGTDICLSYHLRGQCYSNCQRRSTHRALTGAILRRMNTFVNTHCNANPAPPAPPAVPAPPPNAGAAVP